MSANGAGPTSGEFLELSGFRGRLAKANEEYRALVVESYRSPQ